MGVPGFYRWAVRKVRGLRQTTSNAASQFDNLYLDFNGVVHSCIEDWTNQENEAALFALIEAQLLVILSIIRPRLMLYVALDGVAPRAKLNQQRSRRFRAGKAMEEAEGTLDGVIDSFDRNAITPGTEFMARLSAHLRAWAAAAAGLGGALEGAEVVVSSDTDPGEGEHKIMEVIRNRPPTETHCLCSNDADLVFLGLASSAQNIHLLRAKQDNPRAGAAPSTDPAAAAAADGAAGAAEGGDAGAAASAEEALEPGGGGPTAFEAAQAAVLAVEAARGPAARRAAWLHCEAAWAQALAAEAEEAGGPAAAASCDEGASSDSGRYELLSIGAIRDWLAGQFPGCSIDRVAADFVAMCCLAGNDFLPHIEVLDIYNGGLDLLMKAYHTLSPSVAGHLVNKDCSLALPLWQRLLSDFAEAEAEALLQLVGLGRGPRRPPYRGPQPPAPDWDGLSVLVSNVPSRAEEGEVLVAMRKQNSFVRSVHAVRGRGPRSPQLWLVRFEDPTSAVKSLVAVRRVRGARVFLSWTRPELLNLKEPAAAGPFDRADWRPALEEAVLETVEFWLRAENLQGDDFLRRHVRARSDRFVPLRVLASFNRLRVWLQDLNELARVLRRSTALEVVGDGEGAAVRAVADHSLRPWEGPEVVARQQEALALVGANEHGRAARALRADYYRCRAGPEAEGAPDRDDVDAVDHFRSRAFLTGVEWVVRYYVHGCPSWSWFYPSHYPPLCVSLANATEEPLVPPPLHAPFNPELQLLAVLPPQSAALVPEPLRHLLTSPESPVIDFYPTEFEVDLKEGDKEWQAIVLLPFVDEARLRRALEAVPGWTGRRIPFEDARAFQMVQDGSGAWSVASRAFSQGPQPRHGEGGPPPGPRGRDCACAAC